MRAILLFSLAFVLFNPFPQLADAQTKGIENSEQDYKLMGAPIPHFKIKSSEGKIYTEEDFNTSDHLVLILFNPTCDHCIDLGKEMAEHSKGFPNTDIVYIAANGMDDYLKLFIDQTGLDKVLGKSIVMGTDQTPNAGLDNSLSIFLAQIFEFRLPQVNIYSKDRKMTYKKSGVIAFQDIVEQIK